MVNAFRGDKATCLSSRPRVLHAGQESGGSCVAKKAKSFFLGSASRLTRFLLLVGGVVRLDDEIIEQERQTTHDKLC